jgi:hypothetical protein
MVPWPLLLGACSLSVVSMGAYDLPLYAHSSLLLLLLYCKQIAVIGEQHCGLYWGVWPHATAGPVVSVVHSMLLVWSA